LHGILNIPNILVLIKDGVNQYVNRKICTQKPLNVIAWGHQAFLLEPAYKLTCIACLEQHVNNNWYTRKSAWIGHVQFRIVCYVAGSVLYFSIDWWHSL